jgi:hypothetical protein
VGELSFELDLLLLAAAAGKDLLAKDSEYYSVAQLE